IASFLECGHMGTSSAGRPAKVSGHQDARAAEHDDQERAGHERHHDPGRILERPAGPGQDPDRVTPAHGHQERHEIDEEPGPTLSEEEPRRRAERQHAPARGPRIPEGHGRPDRQGTVRGEHERHEPERGRPPHRVLNGRAMALDSGKVRDFVQRTWDESVVPALTEYIRIPAKSPMFDADWRAHGHLDSAVALLEGWAKTRAIEGLRVEVVRLEGRTPLLLMEAPGAGGDTVLLYGHCDKQPEMVGWAEGAGPWTPVRRGDKLYGRGVGDDGYATFAALTAIQALEEQRARHSRCVVLIEACEESGSFDLPAYVDALAGRLGTPSLVVCLDSGCGNYEQLWGTTSLRGVVGGVLTVEVLTEGVHSGAASGIVPSSFRILRQLLDRVEDSRTGQILPRDFHVDIPRERVAEAREVAKVLGTEIYDRFPFPPGGGP